MQLQRYEVHGTCKIRRKWDGYVLENLEGLEALDNLETLEALDVLESLDVLENLEALDNLETLEALDAHVNLAVSVWRGR